MMDPAPLTTEDDKPAGITCGKYVRGEGKRCRHYLAEGGCALPEELICVEWLKLNGDGRRPPPDASTAAPGRKASVPPRQPTGAVTPDPMPERKLPLRGVATEDIAAFAALGIEVHLVSDTFGEVWLVPTYTAQSRRELTLEHARTLARVLEALPGIRVLAIERKAPGGSSPAEGST